jgi:hypothetical protein
MAVEIVFVLIEDNEDGTSVLGVYRDYKVAYAEKCRTIREAYDIPEDEVDDRDLDDEIEPMGAYYEIVTRELL